MQYVAAAAGIFMLDFFLKRHIEKKYNQKERKKKLHGFIFIEKCYNKGAALNFLSKRPRILKGLHTAMMLFMCILFYLYLRRGAKKIEKTGMAFLIGGGLSNLIDRYTKGHVVDYVSFSFGPKWFRRIVFNVSDFFVFIGAALIVLGQS